MLTDIHYAAIAVKAAILEKFGRAVPLEDLEVVANHRTMTILHGDRIAEGTRDNLLAAVRKAESYDSFWQTLLVSGEQLMSSKPH